MYGTLFVCVIAAFALATVEGRAGSDAVPEDGKCIPGKSYKVDCNTCLCNDNHVLACTLAACLDKRSAPDDELKEPCTTGESKTIGNGCNYCTCTPDKKWACIDGDISKCGTDNPKPNKGFECSDGQSKEIDCNKCRCSNGQWACTRRACLSPEELALLGRSPSVR